MLDSLYENIGGKIKSWAKWIFIVEAIGSIIAGIVLAAEEDILYIFIAIIGPFIAWVSSWILYAFGELVENSTLICEVLVQDSSTHDLDIAKNNTEKEQVKKNRLRNIKKSNSFGFWVCPNCSRGNSNSSTECIYCGTKKESE